MAVQLPTGTYTIIVREKVQDAQGRMKPGPVITQLTGIKGRMRTNAQGADLDLDPQAWPTIESPRDGFTVEVRGPDDGGIIRTWKVVHAENRPAALPELEEAAYVTSYVERKDTYQQTQQTPGNG